MAHTIRAVSLAALILTACGSSDDVEDATSSTATSEAANEVDEGSVAYRFSAAVLGPQITSIVVGSVSGEREGDRNGALTECPKDGAETSCAPDEEVPSTLVQAFDTVVEVSETHWGASIDECIVSETRRVEQEGEGEPTLAWDLGYAPGDEVLCLALEDPGVEGLGLPIQDGRIALADTFETDQERSNELRHSPFEQSFDGILVDDAVAALTEIADAADPELSDADAIAIVRSHRSE